MALHFCLHFWYRLLEPQIYQFFHMGDGVKGGSCAHTNGISTAEEPVIGMGD